MPSYVLPGGASIRIVVTCAAGLEEILDHELRGVVSGAPSREQGAVCCEGGWRDVWRANWRLRTANRVLVELASWEAASGDELARGAFDLVTGDRRWGGVAAADLFAPERTFSVRASSARSRLADTRWIALKVKDGIADAQRRRFGRRASVERRGAELPLRLRLARDRATLLLDTSGEPLDRRGYRVVTGGSPVREQLAAACVLAAKWEGRGPVVDPMCGSGTLLSEAGAIALGLPPLRLREQWGLERLPGFDARGWRSVRGEPFPAPGPEVTLHGIDRAPSEVRAAGVNLERAGLAERAEIEVGDAFTFAPPPGPGLLLVNPPYGERSAAEEDQWPRLGDLLKQRYRGWRAVVLAGGESRGKTIGLRPTRRIPVRNGPLDARILVFDLY